MTTTTFSLAPMEPGLTGREVVQTCAHAFKSMSSETKNNLRLGMELMLFALTLFATVKSFVLLPQRMDAIEKQMTEIQLRNNVDHDLLIKLETTSGIMARDIAEIKEAVKAAARNDYGRTGR